jgi:hypothetical protein
MVQYTCELCGKIFDHKGKYNQHLKRITPCNKSILTGHDCIFCNKSFTTKYIKIRHESFCKTPVQIATDDKITALEEKNKKLEEKLQELEQMVKNGVNPLQIINTNSNNVINIQNNTTIILNKYGHEDLSHITDAKLNSIFKKCFMSIPSFIKLKHFSKEKPENCNVYISNIKSQYALIYNGEKWTITDKKKLLNELYDDNCEFLTGEYEEKKSKLDHATIQKFKRFLDSKDDDQTINDVKENIKQILYNEKDMVLKKINS